MKRFANLGTAICTELNCEAVLDGEIVVLDSEGRPRFYDLMRGRGQPVFYVFDLLWLDGKDQRSRSLLERKRILRSIVPQQPSVLLYADHVERYGIDFFRLACELDLEGIVAKRKVGVYGDSWFKISGQANFRSGLRSDHSSRDGPTWSVTAQSGDLRYSLVGMRKAPLRFRRNLRTRSPFRSTTLRDMS